MSSYFVDCPNENCDGKLRPTQRVCHKCSTARWRKPK